MKSAFAKNFLRANRRRNIHLYPDDWKKLPIPDVSPEKQAPIVALVEQILAAKKSPPAPLCKRGENDAPYFMGSSAKYVQADRFRQFPKCMI